MANANDDLAEVVLAELADAFPLDERATATPIGFLSLLTFDDETGEEGGG